MQNVYASEWGFLNASKLVCRRNEIAINPFVASPSGIQADDQLTMAVARCQILVVDDDPAILRLLKIVFESDGWEICTCERAEDALALLAEHKPALVVTDLDMPVVNGEEFYRRARKGGFEGPFVVISGEQNGRLKSARMGTPHMQKPFDPYQLIELVEALVDNEDGVEKRMPPSTTLRQDDRR